MDYYKFININCMLLISEVESFQKMVVSKNKQVEELQSILEMKEEKIKVMEKQVSSSSDVIKQQKDEAVQFNYIVPVSG